MRSNHPDHDPTWPLVWGVGLLCSIAWFVIGVIVGSL